MTRPRHALIRETDRRHIQRGGGAVTTQMVTPESGATAFLNGFTNIPPGGAIPLHYHNCEESVLIVAGTAFVEAGDEAFPADAGDVTWLPAGLPHRFINPSKSDVLRIFWTYASVDATRTLTDSGKTALIFSENQETS